MAPDEALTSVCGPVRYPITPSACFARQMLGFGLTRPTTACASLVVGRAARAVIDMLWRILSISREEMEEIAMRQYLRDNSGNLLGWRQQVGLRINGYTAAGWLVGWYDPKFNATHNSNGHRVGTGDLLSSLIVSKL